jgi:uncharacterized protein DUF5946
MTALAERVCPGCGVSLPIREGTTYDKYFNASPECWALYTEILGAEFGNAALFGQVHMLTVDAYAVQHAGGRHPDKSIAVHLSGLHLTQEREVRPTSVPPLLQRLVAAVEAWPHFEPPAGRGTITVWDVALSGTPEDHAKNVRAWAGSVWKAWSEHHGAIAMFVSRHLTSDLVADRGAPTD